MKKAWMSVLASVAIVAVGSVAQAQQTGFPIKAIKFSTWLARAFDSCTPAGLTVLSTELPSSGCLAAHSDPLPPPGGFNSLGTLMNFGRLEVRRFPMTGGQGKVKLVMSGLKSGRHVKLRLTLRTTRSGIPTKHPPNPSGALVTFQDTVVECKLDATNCFTANARGTVLGIQTLDQCLTQSGLPTGLAKENVEILGAEVVNCDDNNVLARAGILN
jgi:hypothetical protein